MFVCLWCTASRITTSNDDNLNETRKRKRNKRNHKKVTTHHPPINPTFKTMDGPNDGNCTVQSHGLINFVPSKQLCNDPRFSKLLQKRNYNRENSLSLLHVASSPSKSFISAKKIPSEDLTSSNQKMWLLLMLLYK